MHHENHGLAQLARAFDWQSKGHRFDSILSTKAPYIGTFGVNIFTLSQCITFTELQRHLPQAELESCRCRSWEVIDEKDVTGNLVLGDLPLAVVAHILCCKAETLLLNDEGIHISP